MRRFGLCRICFRERALRGLPGVTKSSGRNEHHRSNRRHADPHPQRQPGAPLRRPGAASRTKRAIARSWRDESFIEGFEDAAEGTTAA